MIYQSKKAFPFRVPPFFASLLDCLLCSLFVGLGILNFVLLYTYHGSRIFTVIPNGQINFGEKKTEEFPSSQDSFDSGFYCCATTPQPTSRMMPEDETNRDKTLTLSERYETG